METMIVIKTPTVLNKITGNPWRHCAPYTFPYPKNYKGYHGLDYNDLKNFKKSYILDKLLRPSFEESLLKSKRWKELYGTFCVDANNKILETDMKYIYECMYEMSSHGIEMFLQSLKSSRVTTESDQYQSQNTLSAYKLEPIINLQNKNMSLKSQINSISNSFKSTSDVKNSSIDIEEKLRSKTELSEITYKRAVITNSTITQQTREDPIIFKYPGNYITLPLKIENAGRKYSKRLLTNDQPNLKATCSSMQSQPCPHLVKEDPNYKDMQINQLCLPYKLNPSTTIVKQKRDSATRFEASNFEINEMGDIVLFSVKDSFK